MVWSLLFQANEADAVTVEGGLVFEAGQLPFNLKPIVAEFFGSRDGAFSLGPQVSSLMLQPLGEAGSLSALYLWIEGFCHLH